MAKATSGSTLSTWSQYGRNAIKYGAIGIVLLIVARFTLSTGMQIYKALNPPGPPPPTMGFGQLPTPTFPVQLPNERPSTFVLETVGQRFPSFGTQIPVYYIPGYEPDLLALDQAKEKAAQLGFLFEPEKVSNQVYRWRQQTPLPATLEMDIVNKTFDLETDWASSVTLLDKKFIPDEKQVTSELRTLLRTIGLTELDVATASPQITYLRALAGETKEANSISEADFVQADLYRVAPADLRSVTATPDQGVIRVIFSGSRNTGERVLSFQSHYYPVTWSDPQTYPLQSASQAWEQLLAGQGYVTRKGKDTVSVRSVSLAYYEPPTPDAFYQPVYVFEGDNGFQALVPALDPQVYQSTTAR